MSDRNAASGAALFRPAAEGIAALHEDDVYSEWWNQSRDARQKRCAEVLVPHRIDPSLVTSAYVPDDQAARDLEAVIGSESILIQVNAYLFFRGHRP